MARLDELFKDGLGDEVGQAGAVYTPPKGHGDRRLVVPLPGEARPQFDFGGGSLPNIPIRQSEAPGPNPAQEPAKELPPPENSSIPAPEIPDPTEITVDQVLAALPFAYISGPAGTGKTWLARAVVAGRTDAVLTATTGIAAVNLGDASTINALLNYYDTQSLMEAYASGWLQTRLRQLRRAGVRIIVLDETSMLDANQLTILCQALDEVNMTRSYDRELEEVVVESDQDAALKLLLVGDFAQLPPVEGDFAFQSVEWKRFEPHTFRLDRIRRQGETAFIDALQAIRKGRPTDALPVMEGCMVPTLDFDFPGTTIVAKNDEVDRINGIRHAKLPGEPFVWKTVRSGEQQKDWIRLIPEDVSLKPGALVMVLANRPMPRLEDEEIAAPGFFYVNGDLAHVIEKTPEGMRVKLIRNAETVVVVPLTSEWRVPTGKSKPKFDVKGTVTRMPLRLAYASTVHKTQGLSLDQVQVRIASWMFGKPSMLYVALSRCRTLGGLRLVANPKQFVNKCKVHPAIGAFL